MSHDRVLGDGLPPLVHVGAALPDLWPLLPARPLPLVVLRRLRARRDADAAALAFGVAHHMHADAAFHGHPVFEARARLAAEHLAPHLGPVRHAALAGHVLVEMLLDRWLINGDAHLVERYYSQFGERSRACASELTTDEPDSREALRACLDRFAATRFLADYATFEGLARRFTGALRRTQLLGDVDVDLPALATELRRLDGIMAPGSEDLLDEVRGRADASLDRAGVVRLAEAHDGPPDRVVPSAWRLRDGTPRGRPVSVSHGGVDAPRAR